MTTSSPTSRSRSAREITEPLREPAALALLGAGALVLFGALVGLAPPGVPIPYALHVSTVEFATVLTIAAPVLAVLLTTHVGEQTPLARLVTMIAGGELAVTVFFGLIFTTVIGFFGAATNVSFAHGVEVLFTNGAHVALAAAALFVVFRIWQGLFHVPRPRHVPAADHGVRSYQPGYSQPYGQQPGSPPSSHGQPPSPPTGQSYGAGGQVYGQPSAPPYGQPSVPPRTQPSAPSQYRQAPATSPYDYQPTRPASSPPASGGNVYGHPGAPSAPGGPDDEATQLRPR